MTIVCLWYHTKQWYPWFGLVWSQTISYSEENMKIFGRLYVFCLFTPLWGLWWFLYSRIDDSFPTCNLFTSILSCFVYHRILHFFEKYSLFNYLIKLLGLIDAPVAESVPACRSLANILMKSFVTAHSDREKSAGCLRRKERRSS